MIKKATIFITLIFLISACSLYSIDSKDITTNFYSPKISADEVVYMANITQPYEVIGIVKVNAERRQHVSEVIKKMKYEAAILGGDAITEIESNATGTWQKLPAQDIIGNAYVRSDFTASVVVFN